MQSKEVEIKEDKIIVKYYANDSIISRFNKLYQVNEHIVDENYIKAINSYERMIELIKRKIELYEKMKLGLQLEAIKNGKSVHIIKGNEAILYGK